MEGWIKLHRKLQDNPLWTCEPFTRGQAWIDLLFLASIDESYFYVRGVKVDVKRGQVAWSEVKLSERWGWSRSKLRKFLNDLEKEQQIKQQKSNVLQIITILNYDEYQKKEQQKDNKRTAKEQQKDTLKEDKEGKEDKELNISFNYFWNLYDKKISKVKCESKWKKLNNKEREQIIKTLPDWLKQFTDRQYQPYPITYLNQRRWEDEIQQQRKITKLAI